LDKTGWKKKKKQVWNGKDPKRPQGHDSISVPPRPSKYRGGVRFRGGESAGRNQGKVLLQGRRPTAFNIDQERRLHRGRGKLRKGSNIRKKNVLREEKRSAWTVLPSRRGPIRNVIRKATGQGDISKFNR